MKFVFNKNFIYKSIDLKNKFLKLSEFNLKTKYEKN